MVRCGPKHDFSDKKIFFSISSCRLVRLISTRNKDTGVVSQLTKTAIFLATPMKKKIFTGSFCQRVFFCQFFDRNVIDL